MVVDYLVFRRGKIDVQALYASAGDIDLRRRELGRRDRDARGLVAGWAWGYGLVPALQGPIAKATHNVDISWLTGFGVAAILYYVLTPLLAKNKRTIQAPTAV